MHNDAGKREIIKVAGATVAVASTYLYFLLFAQFGFLHRLEQVLIPGKLKLVMACMGLTGLVGSFVAARMLRDMATRTLMMVGYGGCIISALATLGINSAGGFAGAAIGIGISLSWLTVSLASSLRAVVRQRRIGLVCGLGTGIAYLLSNVPFLFFGSPELKVLAVVLGCLPGALVTWRYFPRWHQQAAACEAAEQPECRNWLARLMKSGRLQADDCQNWGVLLLVVGFAALVWFDSAAFYVAQHENSLNGQTWGSASQVLMLGLTHFLAALIAGAMLGRGGCKWLLTGTYLLFVVAFQLMSRHSAPDNLGAVLYAIGISWYSTALVAAPGLVPDHSADTGSQCHLAVVPIRWRAGLIYGVAGWFGSGMGIGMAENLRTVPVSFQIIAGIVVLALWGRTISRRIGISQSAWRTAFLIMLCLIVISGLMSCQRQQDDAALPTAEAAAITRGKQVYIAEGCIHCHSQYVRPGTADEEMWGPASSLDRTVRPVLIGNRRQGPDLMNAGIRRNAEWHRLHLMHPDQFRPGSRMPSYTYLFDDRSGLGEDLVAYLMSLGSERMSDRRFWEQTWSPDAAPSADTSVEPATEGADIAGTLYQQSCLPCHGANGQGDGPVASLLSTRPRNLAAERLMYAPDELPADVRNLQLARIIKFGLAGTAMPGHEYLADQEILALVDYIQALRQEEKL